jgi:hypothetical protein
MNEWRRDQKVKCTKLISTSVFELIECFLCCNFNRFYLNRARSQSIQGCCTGYSIKQIYIKCPEANVQCFLLFQSIDTDLSGFRLEIAETSSQTIKQHT